MTTLPFDNKDREWLEEIQRACELPPNKAPHIGPPLLTGLVNALLRQDEEIAKLRGLLKELAHARPLLLYGEAWIEQIDRVLRGEPPS